MEKNTVVLYLDDYNELRDFRNRIMGDNVYVVKTQHLLSSKYYYCTKSDAIADLIEQLESKEKLVVKLSNEVSEYDKRVYSTLKAMNLFQLLKWWLRK